MAGGFDIIRSGLDTANINVIDASTGLTNGPGGLIDDSTLDGGNASSHGYAVAGSLPGMSTQILSRSNASEIVDFTYMHGSGAVHYSSIPLDFYMIGAGTNADFLAVYAPNLLAYGVDVWNAKNVPEPGTLALLGIGLLGMGLARRKKTI